MKQVLRLTTIAGLLTLGLASQAQAVPSLQLIACQGSICVATPISVISVSISFPVTVGDFSVAAQGFAIESPAISVVQGTALDVRRTGVSSATPLDLWLVATGFVLPIVPATLDSTHGATFTDLPPELNPASPVSFQGWLNFSNSGLGIGGGGGSFIVVGGLAPPAGSQTNGLITCAPTTSPGSCNVDGNASALTGASVPYSLITRTTFNIPQNTTFDAYTSNSQVVAGPVAPVQQTVPDHTSSILLLAIAVVSLGAARWWSMLA